MTDPHGIAIAERGPHGRWRVECSCGWTDRASSEAGVFREFERHGGSWTVPRTSNQTTAA